MTIAEQPHEELLRRLAISDASALGPAGLREDLRPSALSPKDCALLQLAALVATEASAPSYQWVIGSALAHGADECEIVDVLAAIAPIVGIARLTSAAESVATAIGYDVEERL
jgi:alkylhydroperoxidase/carboxymuconolactone decarboxylase family protein YurZ